MEDVTPRRRAERPRGERLSRLSEVSLRINESLDLDTVLQEVLDTARELTGARYSAITTVDDSGQVEDFLVSGLTDEDALKLREAPVGFDLFRYLSSLPGPLRVGDFGDHVSSLGFPGVRLPVPVTSFLTAPLRHRGRGVGNIYVAKSEPGRTFEREDEETLVMFASQAALVIANARRHRDEQRARAGLETLIETAPVGVVVFDVKTGAPVSINRESRRIAGDIQVPETEAGRFFERLTFRRADGREIGPDEFPLAQALTSGETVRAEEIVIDAPGGQSLTALVNATPVRSEDGEVESVVVTLQDMTPLEELGQLRAEFLGMVSHQLQMPLTSIRGAATTLLDAAPDLDLAGMRQFHRIILEQADHIRAMIGDLLDVARIETGTLHVDPEPTDVAALVDRARSSFRDAGGANQLEFDIPPDLPMVMADRRRIAQVIGNLLSNAARYSPGSSVIWVGAERKGIGVEVSVVDEGRGIAPDDLPRLFRKFARPAAENPGGAGLGLAICKGVVESHGGRIKAESEGLGKGTRFSFTLPAVEEAEQSPVTGIRDARSGGRVLVVDDDPYALRYARDALTEAGYQPEAADDAAEAIRVIGEDPPRLVLLDMVLGDGDGIRLMRDILSIADVPVIFLSVYSKDEIVARALEAGAADYIVKPFSTTELVARVRAALRRSWQPFRAEPSAPYLQGNLVIDYAERSVTVSGKPVALTPIEYDLLVELSAEAGRVVPYARLLQRAWSPGKMGNMRSLRTHMMRLRRKLGEEHGSPKYIFVESRVGYRMPRSESYAPSS